MPQGRFPKLKESVCNIPIQSDDIVNILPRGADSNCLLVAKLKCKQIYLGHVYFVAVPPELIHQTFNVFRPEQFIVL